MPRPTNKLLYSFFKSNKLNQIACYNNDCCGKPLYRHSASLERHLRIKHPDTYSAYIKKKSNPAHLVLPRRLRIEKDLIDLMFVYPILWNVNDENRFNEDLKNKDWTEISEKIGVTVHMCKKKWEYLQDKYKRELAKRAQQPAQKWNSGWKYYNELSFLEENGTQNYPKNEAYTAMSIKEESNDSFSLFDELLEDSNDKEEFSLKTSETEESKQPDANNFTEPHDDQLTKTQNYTQSNMTENPTIKSAVFQDTESDKEVKDNHSTAVEQTKKVKLSKKKVLSESEEEDDNTPDTDEMFLLSLLPFLRSIPKERKLFVRHKMQGVLLEEQQISNNV